MSDHPELLEPYDALLLVSFGGPESPEEVLPFLANVTRGRGIPPERLVEVGEHYFLFGGRSPINDQCRMLLAALKVELTGRGLDIPLFWGNRNSEPFLDAEVAAIASAGHRRVLAVVTSAYPSYSSCRQYRENLYDAAAEHPVQIDRIRHYANHPGFVAASVDAAVTALDELELAQGGSGVSPRESTQCRTVPGWSSSRTRSPWRWPAPPVPSRAARTARTSTGTGRSPPR